MDNKETITLFARTNFRNREVPFGIKTDDRRRHMYLIGKTGMGKTTLMENMVIQDIRNGHGVAFLDPHGDSVQRILNSIPNNRVNDVIYFNPADIEYPLAFNILEAVDSRYKHLVASGLMGVFTKIWANLWSARMEYILNNTILALLDSPGNTLLGITRMYVDKKYRKKIVDNIKDPMVKAFWTDEFANYNEKYRTEAIAPIQNKVGQFLSSGIIRNIVGQPKSTIDLREVMDQRKILIMDLSKGKVGEDNSALLGAMIVTKLQLAAMSRTDIQEVERKDFYLYVDEFQNFATESFATILSEARKYRLNLIVGHQYISQLEQDKSTKVRDAIFGNVGTIVLFRIGAADAEYLETEFEPIFTPSDMVNLPKYNILLKLMINGVASEPFSAVTLAPDPEYFNGNGDKVIKVSRERYTNKVAEVEERISRWMGAEFHQEAAVVVGEDSKQEKPAPPAAQTLFNEVNINEINVAAPEPVIIQTQKASQNAGFETMAEPDPIYVQEKKIQKVETLTMAPPPREPRREETRSGQNSQPLRQQPSHRNSPGRDRQSTRQAQPHSNRPSKSGRNGQPIKKENPIWNTVATLRHEKTIGVEKQVHNAVNKILEKVKPVKPIESPLVNPQQEQISPAYQPSAPIIKVEQVPAKELHPPTARTVLKPGESHTL